MTVLKRTISSVIYQLYANALLKGSLLALSTYLLAATLTQSTLVAFVSGLFGFGAGLLLTKIYQDKRPQAISLIHQHVDETEYSLHLLDKPALTIAEQLQLERLNERVQQVQMPSLLFTNLGLYGVLLLASLAFWYAFPMLQTSPQPERQRSVTAVTVEAEKPFAPTFRTATLAIRPPAYTQLPEKRSADLNATALSGSVLQWQVQFSHSRQLTVRLTNSRGEELTFRKSGEVFSHNDRLVTSGLYAIKAFYQDSLIYQSDFYRLEAQPDLAPKIEAKTKELYQYHYLRDPKTITLSARIADDFRVTQAFMVATVARGSGENVKFREVKFPLLPANFKSANITKTIDLKALNFAPGDELYYYWAAIDNRQPEPNFAKSDTYFIVYKDTSKVDEAELATMAVNIMPEYFRSQRQIIIDTEKLIVKRNKIAQKAFNSTSNEIGFDQKVLRLRYGQYLGEEFENNIGGHALPTEGQGDVLDGFVHKHDDEGEEHDHHAGEPPHDHGHADHKAEGGKEDPLAALMEQYVHSHDDGEANTFYEQSTRSLLKMALEQMWQSELHLRLYEPEKALPFEKKALEYLKSAQQKARAFVKKTGFDPPPIKEKEKRLTGELKNVNPGFSQERVYDQPRVEQLVGNVLGYLELPSLNPVQQRHVQQLSALLTDQVMNSRLANWAVLGSLQKLASAKPLSITEKRQLKTKLYELTGSSGRTGTSSYASDRKLERAFWGKLK
ncbi:hypothetical protein GCM10023189_60340 [Nibrella saemangeumensis]|uniref:DUF4175 domain-containing protein n=1 Tax=Nibrella saemangeumensis TaxID=1084526 RepID=A0ABP8NQ26_9BACT